MDLQVAANLGVGFSRTARAVAELGAVRPTEHELRGRRLDEVRATLRAWRVELDAILAAADRWNETTDVAALVAADLAGGEERRASALETAVSFVEKARETSEVVANAIAFVSSLPAMIVVSVGEGPQLVAADAVKDELTAMRATLVHAAETADDAIDIGLIAVSKLDPDNDGAAISLADLEAKLRGAAE